VALVDLVLATLLALRFPAVEAALVDPSRRGFFELPISEPPSPSLSEAQPRRALLAPPTPRRESPATPETLRPSDRPWAASSLRWSEPVAGLAAAAEVLLSRPREVAVALVSTTAAAAARPPTPAVAAQRRRQPSPRPVVAEAEASTPQTRPRQVAALAEARSSAPRHQPRLPSLGPTVLRVSPCPWAPEWAAPEALLTPQPPAEPVEQVAAMAVEEAAVLLLETATLQAPVAPVQRVLSS
jgi:hypothetical protein